MAKYRQILKRREFLNIRNGGYDVRNVLVTGVRGFIGSALCRRLASGNKVIGVDITGPADGALNIVWEQADLTNRDSAVAICV